jgi:hypothetical protein
VSVNKPWKAEFRRLLEEAVLKDSGYKPNLEDAGVWCLKAMKKVSSGVLKRSFLACGLNTGKLDKNTLNTPLKEIREFEKKFDELYKDGQRQKFDDPHGFAIKVKTAGEDDDWEYQVFNDNEVGVWEQEEKEEKEPESEGEVEVNSSDDEDKMMVKEKIPSNVGEEVAGEKRQKKVDPKE